MKSILWINKSLMVAEDYASYFDDKAVKFHPFYEFHSVSKFIEEVNSVDMIVSGYCTFHWIDRPHVHATDSEICFNFFEKIKDQINGKPFVLYSSILEQDKRSEIYPRIYKNFHSISKNEPKSINEIKKILFGENYAKYC